MKLKLIFGKGHIIADKILVLNCPNCWHGIGSIVVTSNEGFWTGETIIHAPIFSNEGFWTGETIIRAPMFSLDFGIGVTSNEGFWTGETIIHAPIFSLDFGGVVGMETRRNLHETSEKWKTIWTKPDGPFHYEPWFAASKILRRKRSLWNDSK